MFDRLKKSLTILLASLMMLSLPVTVVTTISLTYSVQAEAGLGKWAAKKAIGGLIKIAIFKLGTRAGKAALAKLREMAKDKVKRQKIVEHANKFINKHPKHKKQAEIALASIGILLAPTDDTGPLGGIAGKGKSLVDKIKATKLRNSPGTAYGTKGLPYIKNGDKWLRGTHGNAGLVPKQVGQKLSGRTFKNFDEFRSELWMEISRDKALRRSFSPQNRSRMSNGKAPLAHESQHVGEIKSYQLHHKTPISKGGPVYGLDNIVIVTPRYHKEILEPGYHFGALK